DEAGEAAGMGGRQLDPGRRVVDEVQQRRGPAAAGELGPPVLAPGGGGVAAAPAGVDRGPRGSRRRGGRGDGSIELVLVHSEVVLPPIGMPHIATISRAPPDSREVRRGFDPTIGHVPDFATLLGLVVGTVAVAFAAVTVAGVVLLRRRARRLANSPVPGRTDAGVALVRADEAVRSAADDLAFAVAQFGEDRTRDFARALQEARRDLDRAFALQYRLDDAEPESERRRRDWAKSIRALADRARETVEAEAARFAAL